MIGVFARADHPNGYGFADGRAHGFVIVLVEGTREEIYAVKDHLQTKPIAVPLDSPDTTWYGGKFDLVSTIAGEVVSIGHWPTAQKWSSMGDNRAVMHCTAAEILAA